MLAVDRRLIYRTIASGMLWLMIIMVVIFSFRSVNIVTQTGQIAKQAMTGKDEMQISNVRELAKAFAIEWGTWRGKSDDYFNRINVFLKNTNNIPAPEGIQEINSASVIKIIQEKPDTYRVQLILHARKIINMNQSEAQLIPQIYAPLTRDDLRSKTVTDYNYDNDKSVPVWQNDIIAIEVPIKIKNDYPAVANLPVLIKIEDISEPIITSGYRNGAKPELRDFIEQFLELYYSGGSIKNFITVNANVQPLSAWKLDAIKEIKTNSDKTPTKVYVQVLVSTAGVERLAQNIYLDIKPSGNSYLVDQLSSTN